MVAVRCFRQRCHLYRDSRCFVGFLEADWSAQDPLPAARFRLPPTEPAERRPAELP